MHMPWPLSNDMFKFHIREAADNSRIIKRLALFRCEFSKKNEPRILVDRLPPLERASAIQTVEAVREINRHISLASRTKEILVDGLFCSGSASVFSFEPVIKIPADYLEVYNKINLDMTVTHEASHVFYRQLSVKRSQPVWAAYEQMMKKIGEIPLPQHLSFVGSLEGNSFYTNKFLSLFRESAYYPNAGGHPHSNDGELFASMTTILRHVAGPFFYKICRIGIGKKEMAIRAATAVVRAWGNARLFADEVYQRLGLPIPPELNRSI